MINIFNVNNHQTLIEYKGNLSYEEIGVLLNRMTLKLSDLGLQLPVKKRVYSIMVELLENIYKHKDEEEMEEFHSYFALEKSAEEFLIKYGNIPDLAKVKELKEKIDLVNKLDEIGLKELYKSTILNDKISEKGGAGLGIINIAKISGKKIDYKFQEISTNSTFFTVFVKLNYK